MKLLLDANLSPETAEFLRRRFSFDAVSIIELRKTHLEDLDIIALAKQENQIIITQDLDFGGLYHEADPAFGVIILRLNDQRIESVNLILEKLFDSADGKQIFEENPNTLIVIDETSTRVRKKG